MELTDDQLIGLGRVLVELVSEVLSFQSPDDTTLWVHGSAEVTPEQSALIRRIQEHHEAEWKRRNAP